MTAMGSSDHDVTEHSLSGDDELIDYLIELLVRSSRNYASAKPKDEVRTITLDFVCSICNAEESMFDQESLRALSKVFGVMTKDKLGNAKDFNETLRFMRRCAEFRDNATERVSNEVDVAACYCALGHDLLQNDLLPHQRKDKVYHLRWNDSGDAILTSFHRTFVDNILRKRLGDKKLAFHIWQHGLPRLIDAPLVLNRDGTLTKAIEECCHWYASFARGMATYEASTELRTQRALGGTHKGKKLSLIHI